MTFIAKRFAQLLAVVIAVTALTYFAQVLLPGDPAITICGTAGQQCVDEYRAKLNLDDPAPVRYVRWLSHAAVGDLGTSANTKQEVREALGERGPVTLTLVIYSQLIALFVAIPVGLVAAQRVGTGFDRSSTGCAFALLAVPAFIAAPPLVAIFAVKLKWFNATGYAGLELWVLLLQLIFFALLVPLMILLNQRIAPGLSEAPGISRALAVGAAAVSGIALVYLGYAIGWTGLGSPVIGLLLMAPMAALTVFVLRSLLTDDDPASFSSGVVFFIELALFVIFIIVLKMKFPLPPEGTEGAINKFANQGLFDVKGLFLPSVVLAIAEMATYMRLLRSDLISTLQEDYITMAKAKGLSPRAVMMKHAFRPSTFSLITVAGLNFGRLIGGTLVVEFFFSLPGIGKYLVESVLRRDYIAVQGAIVLITVCYVGVVFILDAVYAVLDPRIRHARVVV